jgi:hypothetical protein
MSLGETSRNGILRTLRPQEGGPLFAQGSIAALRDSSVDVPDVVTSEIDVFPSEWRSVLEMSGVERS